MALLPWGDEDERKKQSPFQIPTVQSVQNSWQPTQASTLNEANYTTDQDNYLMSDQKAQFDQTLEKNRQIEEANRVQAVQQAAQKAAAVRQQQAAQAKTTPLTPTTGRKFNTSEPKSKNLLTELGNFGRDVVAGVQQSGAAVADTAVQAGGVLGYVGDRIRGIDDQTAGQRMINTAGAARKLIQSGKDITGKNFIGTSDVDDAATAIANGRASAQDVASVAGKALQVGLDSTSLLSPSRLAFRPVTAAPIIGRNVLSSPAFRYALRDGLFYGGLQAGATGSRVYGETGDVGEAVKAGLTDGLIGGTLQGGLDLTGNAIGRGREALTPVIRGGVRRPSEFRIGNETAELIDTPTPGVQMPDDGNISFNREQTLPTEDRVITLPRVPAIATNYTPASGFNTPAAANGVANLPSRIADNMPTITSDVPQNMPTITSDVPESPAADGVARSMADAETSVTPVTRQPEAQPVADGTVLPRDVIPVAENNAPQVRSEQIRNLQDARAGASQADEAVINEALQEAQSSAPVTNSLPDDMNADITATNPNSDLTPDQQSDVNFAERFMTPSGNTDSMKQNLAEALGMGKDTSLEIDDLLKDANPKTTDRVKKLWTEIEKIHDRSIAIQKQNQADFISGNPVNKDINKEASLDTSRRAGLERRLMAEVRKLNRKGDIGEKFVQGLENVIQARSANMLTSASVLERAATGEIGANIISGIKNPIKTVRGAVSSGNTLKSSLRSTGEGLKVAPKTATEVYNYVVGNAYRGAMTPADALARTRRGGFRTELTKWAYQNVKGKNLSTSEAERLSRTAGNHTEMMANVLAGVDNFMVSNTQAMRALREWKNFIETGDSGALKNFETIANKQATLISRLSEGFKTNSKNRGVRAALSIANGVFPFVRVAINAADTAATKTLNPFAQSVLDAVRRDQRSKGANLVKVVTNKMVDYGLLAGAAALAGSQVLAYNDGDEVDKPRGWSIKVSDDEYVPIRATPIELPLAIAGATTRIAQDVQEGKARDFDYYLKMVSGSLPYLDTFEQTTGTIDSLKNIGGSEGDNGYAAKSYGVNLAKSLIPASNNGLQEWNARNQGQSMNAKSVYDKDIMKWFENTVMKSYSPEFREGLKDSRDAAGRVRTVDNQGALINKRINDPNTAVYNDDIDDLVGFARQMKLGNGTTEMFNTYDQGKNNNFKSVQDSITFLDAADGKPDNTKKLEANGKLSDLSRQIRDGFYGDTGSELLTLNGQELKSDVSVPTTTGSKNTKLPLSMQSIKNAIAQTDLGEEANAKLFEISQQKNALYAQRKNKEITYDQEQAAKAGLNQEEIAILSGSENYKRLVGLMDELDTTGFFEDGGLGSTKSGQTYLWNSLNALLGSKGATPAANYPEDSKFTPWGGRQGTGRSADAGAKNAGLEGLKWTPAGARQLASVNTGRYTPVSLKVKLGNEIRKDRSQNYSDRSF